MCVFAVLEEEENDFNPMRKQGLRKKNEELILQ